MFLLVMVLTTLLFAVRDVSTHANIITMDEFVDAFTETLILWNSRSNGGHGRERRSTESSSATQQSEYVQVNCNLMCIIETQDEALNRQVLVCADGSIGPHQNGIPVRPICVEHASGRLLHMVIAVPNASVDYLDNGFAKAVSNALRTMTAEPETLYLTIEIPLLVLRQSDFTALSSKMRRLSIYLGQAVHVDRNVLTSLSLESFALEGCRFKETRVLQNDSRLCDVNLLYTCPKIGTFALSADRLAWKRLCPETPDNRSIKHHLEKKPLCACNDYRALLEELQHPKKVYLETTCAMDSDYKQFFIISLVTNLLLGGILLVVCLLTAILYVQNYQRSYMNKA